jgi:hypothetical protein
MKPILTLIIDLHLGKSYTCAVKKPKDHFWVDGFETGHEPSVITRSGQTTFICPLTPGLTEAIFIVYGNASQYHVMGEKKY